MLNILHREVTLAEGLTLGLAYLAICVGVGYGVARLIWWLEDRSR